MTPIRVFAAALACSALGASVTTPAEAEIYRPSLGRGGGDREISMTPTRLLAALLFAQPHSLQACRIRPKAEIYRPWCAQYYGFGGGGTNCGFISYEQCMMTAFGAGAWCVQNPWYLAYGDGSQKAAATARRARSRQR